jgi:DNA-binding protein YbaB
MSSAQAQAQVDSVLADLEARVARGREQQASAMSVTGSAKSRDGSVHATVDASGVVTNLRFAPNVFEQTNPERLAQTVTATIQAAATQARARMAETYETIRKPDVGVLSQAARGTGQLGLSAVGVPAVPRTVVDPTAVADSWHPGDESPKPDYWQELAPEPAQQERVPEPVAAPEPAPVRTPPPPPRTRVAAVDSEVDDDNERPW